MLVYKDYVSFTVLGKEIILISDETESGRNTVVEIDNNYYYIGNEYPTIAAAIFGWQDAFERDLTQEELRQTLVDNNVISSAV
jgi:hypothetical protein